MGITIFFWKVTDEADPQRFGLEAPAHVMPKAVEASQRRVLEALNFHRLKADERRKSLTEQAAQMHREAAEEQMEKAGKIMARRRRRQIARVEDEVRKTKLEAAADEFYRYLMRKTQCHSVQDGATCRAARGTRGMYARSLRSRLWTELPASTIRVNSIRV